MPSRRSCNDAFDVGNTQLYCNHGIAVTDSITTELDCKHKGLDREREMEKEWLGRCACFASRRGSHASTLLSNHLTVYINKHVAMEWVIKATRWTRYQLASYQTQSPQRRHWDNRRRRGQQQNIGSRPLGHHEIHMTNNWKIYNIIFTESNEYTRSYIRNYPFKSRTLSSQLHENAVTHKDYFTSRFSALRFFGGMMQAIIFVPIHNQKFKTSQIAPTSS